MSASGIVSLLTYANQEEKKRRRQNKIKLCLQMTKYLSCTISKCLKLYNLFTVKLFSINSWGNDWQGGGKKRKVRWLAWASPVPDCQWTCNKRELNISFPNKLHDAPCKHIALCFQAPKKHHRRGKLCESVHTKDILHNQQDPDKCDW